MKSTRVLILTSLAMIAFASNSLLCRLALKQMHIDAATFTSIRIVAGAAALCLLLPGARRFHLALSGSSAWGRDDSASRRLNPEMGPVSGASPFISNSPNSLPIANARSPLFAGDWISALALFTYAAAFSFAYTRLPAGTGALLLFGAVQATMISWGVRTGERLDVIQITGLVAAMSGLVVLVLPGVSAPSLVGSILMLSAGLAWGVYSLRGKISGDPIASTAGNFIRAVLFAAVTTIIAIRWIHSDFTGVAYAVLSGAITSGFGYVIWYAALPGLKAASAATVQLSVPVLTAAGGILLLGEPITLRYVLASIAVLGGIAFVLQEKLRLRASNPRHFGKTTRPG